MRAVVGSDYLAYVWGLQCTGAVKYTAYAAWQWSRDGTGLHSSWLWPPVEAESVQLDSARPAWHFTSQVLESYMDDAHFTCEHSKSARLSVLVSTAVQVLLVHRAAEPLEFQLRPPRAQCQHHAEWLCRAC